MKIGIDKLGFYTSNYYVDMAKLAQARNEDPNKYLIGIGQSKMAVIPPTQDVVTMAANAAEKILTPTDKENIDLVLFATESGIDNSKAAAIYVADLLGLKKEIRAIELKQACYAATGAIQLAKGYLALNPTKKVLIFGADISRYGLKTGGEPTQGGGAVAILMSCEPQLLVLEDEVSLYAENIMDFWRPIGKTEALVDGKFSATAYMDFFKKVIEDYLAKTKLELTDFKALLFHLPYTKMGLKSLKMLLEQNDSSNMQNLLDEFEAARVYNRQVGNLYTGSLYLSLLSLLDNSQTLQANDRIGLFSYGSGAQGEFFSALVQPGYQKYLQASQTQNLLAQRKELSVVEYEAMFNAGVLTGPDQLLDVSQDDGTYVLSGIKSWQRQYQKQK